MGRRAAPRIIVGLLVTGLVAIGALAGKPLYMAMVTRRIPLEFTAGDHAYRGFVTVKRWGESSFGPPYHGLSTTHYLANGLIQRESYHQHGRMIRSTHWNLDGTVAFQVQGLTNETRQAPPWWWGAADQRAPSAPWWSLEDERKRLRRAARYRDPWWLAMLRRVPTLRMIWDLSTRSAVVVENETEFWARRGWAVVKRGSDPPIRHGRQLLYFVANDLVAEDAEYRDGQVVRRTLWELDGSLYRQYRRRLDDYGNVRTEHRHQPPWWWGVSDHPGARPGQPQAR